MDRISRRKLLTTLSSGSALALAGCNTDSTSSETAQSTPTRTATDSPTPTDAPFTVETTDQTQNLEPVPIENEETRNTPAGGVLNVNDPDGLDTVTTLLNGRETSSQLQDGNLVWETGQNWIRPGENTLQVEAKDKAGNQYKEGFSFETPEIPFLLSIEDPSGQGLETGYQTDRKWDTHQVQTTKEDFQEFYDNDFVAAEKQLGNVTSTSVDDVVPYAEERVNQDSEYHPVQDFIYGLGEGMWAESDISFGSGGQIYILNGLAREYSDELLEQDYHFFWTYATTGDENKEDTGYQTHEQGYVVNKDTGNLEWLYKPRFNTVTEPGDEVRRPGVTKYFDDEEWKDALGLDFEKLMRQDRLSSEDVHNNLFTSLYRIIDSNGNDIPQIEERPITFLGKEFAEDLFERNIESFELNEIEQKSKTLLDLMHTYDKNNELLTLNEKDGQQYLLANIPEDYQEEIFRFEYNDFAEDVASDLGISESDLESVL